jgi:hypothetical protein
MIDVTIKGVQEAQQRNQRVIAELKPAGAMGRAVQYATATLQRYAIGITHVDTGSLRASHRMSISGTRGTIYIDPGSTNPRSGNKPSIYGLVEHARGGSHAFYGRTIAEAGPQAVKQASDMIKVAVERA